MICTVCGNESLCDESEVFTCSSCGSIISKRMKVIKDNKTNVFVIVKAILLISVHLFIIFKFGIHELAKSSVFYLVIVLIFPYLIDIRLIRFFKEKTYSYKRDFSTWIIRKTIKGFYPRFDNGTRILVWSIMINYITAMFIVIIGNMF